MNKYSKALFGPILTDNPVVVQILGICSTLAVTSKLSTAVVMSIALTFVLTFSSFSISLIRNYVSSSARILIEMTVIASLVIVADQFIKAYAFNVSKQLSVYVGLIITNCILLGRAEAYALKNPPIESALDGLGNGAGYSLILIVIGSIRELIGSGRFFGLTVLPLATEGGWYVPNGLFRLAPSAFIMIGLIVWAVRVWKPELIEEE